MIVKTVSAKCDNCLTQTGLYSSAVEAKRDLRTAGWRFRNGIHTCPTCSASRTTNTATMEAHQPEEEQEVEI